MRVARSLEQRDDSPMSWHDCAKAHPAAFAGDDSARGRDAARVRAQPAMRPAVWGHPADGRSFAAGCQRGACSKRRAGRRSQRCDDSGLRQLAFSMNFPQAADCPDSGLG